MINNQTGMVLQTFLYMVSISNKPEVTDVGAFEANQAADAAQSAENMVRCYDEFGCFRSEHPWTDRARPVSMLPQEPDKIQPGFCLYTRHNHRFGECQMLHISDRDSLYRSYIFPGKPTFFVAHGYLESGRKPWVYEMAAALLRRLDCNVVVVDWSGGSGPPYAQAVANIRLVGVMAAHLLRDMIAAGVQPENVHVIGHSLGAHLSGYLGHTLQERFGYKLGRISGLDPAEPHFSMTDPVVRLDPTDADFVDVIHTDASPFIRGGLGINDPVGHVDFYPNGGRNQPGCNQGVVQSITQEKGSLFQGLHQLVGCSHIRSYQYFTESLSSDCGFLAAECESWELFQNGSCFSCSEADAGAGLSRYSMIDPSQEAPLCARMGFNANSYLRRNFQGRTYQMYPTRTHVKLFLTTASSPPYCRHQYRVTLKVSGTVHSLRHGGEVCQLWLTLTGQDGTSDRIPFNWREQFFEPGATYRVVLPASSMGPLRSAKLELEYHTSLINPLTWRLINYPRLYLAWLSVEELGTNNSMVFCTNPNTPLVSQRPLELQGTHPNNATCVSAAPAA